MVNLTFESLNANFAVCNEIIENGPIRVLINAEGTAVAPFRTNILPKYVFIRDDGWCLGAPSKFRDVAYRMWQSEWIAYIDLRSLASSKMIRPISEYKPR